MRSGQIFDAHYHGAWPNSDDAEWLAARLKEMDRLGIGRSVVFVTQEDDLDIWLDGAHGERFIAGPMLPCPPLDETQRFCFTQSDGWPDLVWLEREILAGRIGLIGELPLNYYGIAPADPRLDPYLALAARHDLPVLAHSNSGPPPGRGPRRYEGCCPDFDAAMGDPDLWRPVLERYPDLKLVLQHSGFPYPAGPDGKVYLAQTIALLRDYPQVMIDVSILDSVWDEDSYRLGMTRFQEAGVLDRIMFGSDNTDAAIVFERLGRLEFLDESERRAILYDNAARFFGLEQR